MELNNEQFAGRINDPEEGGASVNFATRKAPEGRGFMTAYKEGEQSTELPATPQKLEAYQEKHAALVSDKPATFHGAWKNPKTPGTFDQDVSLQVRTPKESQKMGELEQQKAAYALPHTAVNRTGAKVGKYGGDVLFHTADLGKNDVDPHYQPGALDMKGDKGSFTKNQYQNKDWEKMGATPSYDKEGEPINYGHVLRTINENRVNRLRGTAN
jgi:hypothetical protein